MKEPEITVDIGEIDLDTIVGERYHRVGEEDYDREPVTLGHLVAEMITERIVSKASRDDEFYGLKRRVIDVRNEVIRERVEPIIDEALSGEIRKTNIYGEPTGQTTTLREEIVSEAMKMLGKNASGSMHNREKTVLQQIIGKEVERVVRKDLTDAMAEAREKVIQAVRAEGVKIFTDMVQKGAKVL